MENLILSPQSQNVITDYINKSCLVPYEKHLLNEMRKAVEQNDQVKQGFTAHNHECLCLS